MTGIFIIEYGQLWAQWSWPTLGAVSYRDDSHTHAMRFQVDGREFELRQAIGSVVNLLTGNRELFQFNLSNPEAKDRFLEALGDALASKA